MNCPSCQGPIDVSGVFPGALVACPACGAEARASAAPTSPSKKAEAALPPPLAPLLPTICPGCQAELVLRHHDVSVVSACPDGHGVFVTHVTLRELQKIATPSSIAKALDATSSPSAEGDLGTTRPCPRCRAAMTRRAAEQGEDVLVDVCADHGTWFDAGELRQVLSAHASAGPAERAERADVVDRQAKATLDVALALENARDEETMRRGVQVAEDILDVVLGTPYRRRRGLF